MSSPIRGLSIFFTLVLCVYLLRNIEPSPHSSFKRSLETLTTSTNDTNPALLEDICKDFVFNSSSTASRVAGNKKLMAQLTTFRGGNRLIDLVNSLAIQPVDAVVSRLLLAATDTQKELGKSYAFSMLWLIIGMSFFLMVSLICLLGFCCTSINCCQKPCRCFFWANGERGKWPLFILSALLLAGVIVLASFGMKTSDHIDDDSAKVVCTTNFIVSDIINGNLSRGWLGLNTTADKMNYILTNSTNLQTNINSVSQVNDGIQKAYTSASNSINTVYDKYAGSTLPRPDTSVASTYTPDFITNLGPVNSDASTTTKTISQQIDSNLLPFTQASAALLQAITNFQSSSTALPTFEKGRDLSVQGSTFAQKLIDTGNSYTSEIETVFKTSESSVRKVFFGIVWLGAIAIGFSLVNLLQLIKFPIFVNCAWLLLILFSIICWIVSIILVPSTITFMETCDAAEMALHNATFFSKVASITTDKTDAVNQYIYPCLFGNPDLPSIFGIVGAIDNFNVLADYTSSAALDLSTKASAIPQTLTTATTAVAGLEPIRLNSQADAQAITDDLKTLNTNSKSTSTCQPMQDTWLLSYNYCGSSDGSMLSPSRTETFNAGAATCVGFDSWSTGTTKDIRNRYTALKYIKDCQEQPDEQKATTTQTLVPAFVANRNALQTLVTGVQTSLNLVQSNYTNFAKQMNGLAFTTNSMNDAIKTIGNLLNNPNDGIVTHLKCNIIPEDLKVFQDAVCDTTVPNMFYISLLTLAIALVSSFASVSVFCLARKLSPPPAPKEDLDETNDSEDEKKKKKKKKTQSFEMVATRVY